MEYGRIVYTNSQYHSIKPLIFTYQFGNVLGLFVSIHVDIPQIYTWCADIRSMPSSICMATWIYYTQFEITMPKSISKVMACIFLYKCSIAQKVYINMYSNRLLSSRRKFEFIASHQRRHIIYMDMAITMGSKNIKAKTERKKNTFLHLKKQARWNYTV